MEMKKKKEEYNGPSGTFRPAPEAKKMAEEIINSYHPHLEKANIIYLFRTGSWKSKGRLVTGKALAIPQMWRFVSGYDLVVMVNEVIWTNLKHKGRQALIDHELSRFEEPNKDKEGNMRWGLREEDLKEFSQVIKRYGICIGNPQTLMELSGQINLQALEENIRQDDSGENPGRDFDDDFIIRDIFEGETV